MATRRQSNWARFFDAMREPSDPFFEGSTVAGQPSRLSPVSAPPSMQDAITGTEGNDFLQGTVNADTIDGLGGNDFIRGLGGDDVVNGGAGNDILEGGSNGSRDLDPGNDALFGGDGDDFLRSGPGVDVFDGGAGFDRISFFLLNSTQGVVANLATQTISNDGFGNTETMVSVEGMGTGSVFADTLIGDGGVNFLIGDFGDTLAGAGGDDFFSIGGAPVSIEGGEGLDTILTFFLSKLVPDTNGDGLPDNIVATHGVIVDLSTQSILDDGFGGAGALTSIERVGGSQLGDTITGNDQADQLSGYLGNDQLNGGIGSDTLFGGAGADTLNGGDGADELHGGGESGIALGSGGITRLAGSGNVDLATALDISNEFIGGDLFCSVQVQASGDGAVHVYKINLLHFGATLTLNPFSIGGAPISVSILDSNGNSVGSGSAGEVTATVNSPPGPGQLGGQPGYFYMTVSAPGGAGLLAGQDYFLSVRVANELDFGADTLNGGAGADLMIGGWGNDTYFVDNPGDTIVEVAPVGQIVDGLHLVDSVNASVNYAMVADLENLTLLDGALNGTGNDLGNIIEGNTAANQLTGGAGDDELSGHAGDDTLVGGDGADILDGDSGVDTMIGGLGNDFYVVTDVGDVVSEDDVAGGVDTVTAFVSFSLAAAGFVENLTLFDALFAPNALNAVGNDLNNIITGNAVANQLFGLAGADVLNGGAGADQMFGGLGNDHYFVDDSADFTFEAQSAWGLDLVEASVSYALGRNIDNLTLVAGSGAINGLGNLLANELVGNDSANMLFGFAGNDSLGDAFVFGGPTTVDQMYGGEGDDTYIVDNSADVTFEANAAWGIDTVIASVDYQLGTNIDNLTLVLGERGLGNGLANIIGGNGGVNILFGFGGNDTLNGGAGADQMYGGLGDDTYIVDNSADFTFEAQSAWGVDLVQASATFALGANIDNLTLTGSANIDGAGNGLANVITGNDGANMLNGMAGNDRLSGGVGNDTLFGGAGDDAFVFGPGSGSDTVGGFVAGGVEDTINLQAYNGSGVTWTITQVGADTLFAFTNGDQITLTNVIAANLVHDPLDAFLYS